MRNSSVVVVGLGEVGRPLLELVSRRGGVGRRCRRGPVAAPPRGSVDVMHLCFPFEVERLRRRGRSLHRASRARLTVVNSTVAVGTTRAIHERTGARIAYSPVRGKHARMLDDLRSYVKFVGGIDAHAAGRAAAPLRVAGPADPTGVLARGDRARQAHRDDLLRTAHRLGAGGRALLRRLGARLRGGRVLLRGGRVLPARTYFPGVIGGHCVMPNIEILERLDDSPLLQAIQWSNARKMQREA